MQHKQLQRAQLICKYKIIKDTTIKSSQSPSVCPSLNLQRGAVVDVISKDRKTGMANCILPLHEERLRIDIPIANLEFAIPYYAFDKEFLDEEERIIDSVEIGRNSYPIPPVLARVQSDYTSKGVRGGHLHLPQGACVEVIDQEEPGWFFVRRLLHVQEEAILKAYGDSVDVYGLVPRDVVQIQRIANDMIISRKRQSVYIPSTKDDYDAAMNMDWSPATGSTCSISDFSDMASDDQSDMTTAMRSMAIDPEKRASVDRKPKFDPTKKRRPGHSMEKEYAPLVSTPDAITECCIPAAIPWNGTYLFIICVQRASGDRQVIYRSFESFSALNIYIKIGNMDNGPVIQFISRHKDIFTRLGSYRNKSIISDDSIAQEMTIRLHRYLQEMIMSAIVWSAPIREFFQSSAQDAFIQKHETLGIAREWLRNTEVIPQQMCRNMYPQHTPNTSSSISATKLAHPAPSMRKGGDVDIFTVKCQFGGDIMAFKIHANVTFQELIFRIKEKLQCLSGSHYSRNIHGNVGGTVYRSDFDHIQMAFLDEDEDYIIMSGEADFTEAKMQHRSHKIYLKASISNAF